MADQTQNSETQPLRVYAAARGLPVGACVDMTSLAQEPQYGEVLGREFNMCVAENVFKPGAVWAGPEALEFASTDRLVQFARDNTLILRGHTLVWHQSVPKWLREGNYSSGELRDLLRASIHAIVGRYRGAVAMWDVVNEAVTDGDASDWRTDSFWYQTLGPEYLNLAFAWAHEADPDVPLYYNDYQAEDLNSKSDRIYRLVQDLLAAGAPIHGIGLQGHLINGWRATDANRANIRRLTALDLDWQVTEADIRIPVEGQPPTEQQLADQAAGYHDLISLCLTEPRCQGFVTWGFTDKHSWIPGFFKTYDAGLPLDAKYRPKPAYDALVSALRDDKAIPQDKP